MLLKLLIMEFIQFIITVFSYYAV